MTKTYRQRCKEEMNKVPKKIQQKFLDGMFAGKTLGESAKNSGINNEVAGEILMKQLESRSFLNPKIK